MAAGLRSSTTHTIGLISDVVATTPFAGQMLHGAQEVAWTARKLISVINTEGDPEVARAALVADELTFTTQDLMQLARGQLELKLAWHYIPARTLREVLAGHVARQPEGKRPGADAAVAAALGHVNRFMVEHADELAEIELEPQHLGGEMLEQFRVGGRIVVAEVVVVAHIQVIIKDLMILEPLSSLLPVFLHATRSHDHLDPYTMSCINEIHNLPVRSI